MKKKYIIILLLLFTIFTGCKNNSSDSVIKDFKKKVNDMNSYQITGVLTVANNEDSYNYDVVVSYKKDDNYRVSLINKSNNHEQIILKNSSGVYVITPALNKSFKFQSNWPSNNSQIYILNSIVNDIENDKDKKFETIIDGYVITAKANYPNNADLVNQKIYLDKDKNITKVEVINGDGITEMTMIFNKVDNNPTFSDDYFDLNSIISDIDTQTGDDAASAIDDIIYPLYIPNGTVLADQEKVAKDKGERIILTFDGEKPFLLVEETSTVEEEFVITPIFGDPYLLSDTVGAITNNSISWSSNGIDYYIVSDVMSKTELIEIAESMKAIPIIK